MPAQPYVSFLYGNDEYAIARRIKQYQGIFSDPSVAEMNTTGLDGRGMSDDEFNNALNSIPFLASKRLVILANPTSKNNSPEQRAKFCELVGRTPATAQLVIHEQIEPREIDKHWLVKWALKNRNLVETQVFLLPPIKTFDKWIISEVRNQGGQIELQAAVNLAGMVGNDTRQAAQEIAKLLAYVNWNRRISVEDVEAVCLVSAGKSVFDFVDALANGEGNQAQSLLHRLLETDDPFALWGMVVRQFRLLIQAREIIDNGGGKEAVAQALHVHPFVAEKASGQARRFSIETLEAIYHRFLEIDSDLKSGRLTLELALDLIVMELAG